MNKNTTKPAGDLADAKLLAEWFDLTETDIRTKVDIREARASMRFGFCVRRRTDHDP